MCSEDRARDECDFWDFWSDEVKPINVFPYIAMLVITVLLILMFGGYFQ